MKRTLSLIVLAVLSVGLLGSCSKINERLDNLEKKVDGIENEQIASINTQITNINSSIADLGQIRSDITSLKQSAENHGQDIFALQEADEALGDRIVNLEDYLDVTLPTFAEKDWVIATFSTLEQYEATCDTIAKIEAKLGTTSEKLSKDIKACADSLTKWVNKTFEGYYTAAQMDAKLAEMKSAIDSAKASGKISDAKFDSLANELTKTKTAVDTAKAAIRAEYKAAVKSAIETSEGKLTKALQEKITAVNDKIESLTTRVVNLETSVSALKDKVKALEAMIQSVTIVPAYNDGSVKAVDGILTLDIIVEPAGAVAGLTEDSLKVLVNEVKTKAVSVDTVAVTDITVDAAKGTITASADISSKLPAATDKALTVAVNVKNGLSDFTTEFVAVTATAVAAPTFKAVYDTNDDANTLTFYYDTKTHSGEGDIYDNLPSAATEYSDWGYNSIRTSIKSVKIDPSVAGYKGLTSTVSMFQSMINASSISGAEYLDVSNVTDMSYMFTQFGLNTTNFNVVPDVSGWNTGNVTNMSNMFYGYGKNSETLAGVPVVTDWSTSNVTDMSRMFWSYGNSSKVLNDVPEVKGWNTGSVKDMSSMFASYGHDSKVLNDVPEVKDWNTGSVKDMSSMFATYGYTSEALEKIPEVAKWNTGEVSNMSKMFSSYGHDSKVLKDVPDVKDWNTGSVTDMSSMFEGYGNNSPVLDAVPIVSGWNTGNVTKMTSMFLYYGCNSTALTTVPDVSNWDTGSVVEIYTLFRWYCKTNSSVNIDCKLDLSGWNLASVTSQPNIFEDFNPKTFDVTIPAKTGSADNTESKWYVNGSDLNLFVEPPTGKYFIPVLPGEFSVSESKKVRFSRGNLWYGPKTTGASSTFNFETNQYDISSTWNTSHVSNFYWSQTASSAHATTYDNAGSTTDVLFTNATETTPNAGFTVNGNAGVWRTLSRTEWQYLLANHTYKYVPVNGRYGIVIAPDGFSGAIVESYDASTWATAEAAGFVFLPNTGFRQGSSISEVSGGTISCIYWTSTAAPNNNEGKPCAYRMFFQWKDSKLSTDFEHDGLREWAVGIRLVTDVPTE